MTTRAKRSAKSSGIDALVDGDRNLLKQLMRETLQDLLEAEMSEALGAGPGERREGRRRYRAGYYSRGLVTRIGKLELRVPRDRDGRFFDGAVRPVSALGEGPGERAGRGEGNRQRRIATIEQTDPTGAPVRSKS